jgi:hypothetical protein
VGVEADAADLEFVAGRPRYTGRDGVSPQYQILALGDAAIDGRLPVAINETEFKGKCSRRRRLSGMGCIAMTVRSSRSPATCWFGALVATRRTTMNRVYFTEHGGVIELGEKLTHYRRPAGAAPARHGQPALLYCLVARMPVTLLPDINGQPTAPSAPAFLYAVPLPADNYARSQHH